MAKGKKSSASSPAKPGDLVKITAKDSEHEGVLLPATANDADFVTIKLKSGYNIGVANSKISSIGLVEKQSAEFLGAKKSAPMKVSKPYSSLLTCGGTIASRIDYRTGAVVSFMTPQELLEGLPKVQGLSVKPRPLFTISSEDMAPAHWKKIAEAAHEELSDGAEGVVITHGTDTMHYTSAALSFMLQKLPSPVILTGSQRSSDRGSSDARQNMLSALVASKSDLSGVFICMHENLSDEVCALHFGTKTRKMHSSRRDAFHSINVPIAARVFPSQERFERSSPLTRPRGAGKPSLDTKMNENVSLFYIYPGIKPSAISSLSKYDGVVLMGTGLGHLPVNSSNDKLATSILPQVKELTSSGVAVAIASQTLYGRIDMDVYSPGRELQEAGVIGNLCDMTPETAYVKLMWVLGHEKKMGKVKKLMETSLVGEISERSEIVDY